MWNVNRTLDLRTGRTNGYVVSSDAPTGRTTAQCFTRQQAELVAGALTEQVLRQTSEVEEKVEAEAAKSRPSKPRCPHGTLFGAFCALCLFK